MVTLKVQANVYNIIRLWLHYLNQPLLQRVRYQNEQFNF